MTTIKGYRDLKLQDIEAISRIKELGAEIEDRINKTTHIVREMRSVAPLTEGEQLRLDEAQPERWIAIARTHFQEGLMALTRAIAQPSNF